MHGRVMADTKAGNTAAARAASWLRYALRHRGWTSMMTLRDEARRDGQDWDDVLEASLRMDVEKRTESSQRQWRLRE